MYYPNDHTFVLCAYGESPYLEDCLHSLLDQTVKTNLLISTSTPNRHIAEIAHSYGVDLLVNNGMPGISHDWVCAISHCDTPLVTIAHQDDLYLPDFAEATLAAFNCSSRPLISFTDYGELRNGEAVDSSRLLNVKRLLLAPLRLPFLRASKFVRRRTLSVGSPICCPSVTYCVGNLPEPLFLDNMKCDLDWEAWERFSRLDGDFLYIPQLLMRHRIHEDSETTALIRDDTRASEDLTMLEKFWPVSVARFINRFYSKSMASNDM